MQVYLRVHDLSFYFILKPLKIEHALTKAHD